MKGKDRRKRGREWRLRWERKRKEQKEQGKGVQKMSKMKDLEMGIVKWKIRKQWVSWKGLEVLERWVH